MPVGFKWFVDGLLDGWLGFAGEESAGASFLRRDGTVWTTDKDGIIAALLAAEMTARTGRDPGEIYAGLTRRLRRSGLRAHRRAGDPRAEGGLHPAVRRRDPRRSLAGEPIRQILTNAPGDGNPIGGVKVVSDGGWFAARPSGTEEIYKIYAESFRGAAHLRQIQDDARRIVAAATG